MAVVRAQFSTIGKSRLSWFRGCTPHGSVGAWMPVAFSSARIPHEGTSLNILRDGFKLMMVTVAKPPSSRQSSACSVVHAPDVIAVDRPGHQMIGIDGLQDVVDLGHRRDIWLVVAAIVANICAGVTVAHS